MDAIDLYLSAPLFSQVQRKWNRQLAECLMRLIPGSCVHLPQDFRVKDKFNDPKSFPKIFARCSHLLAQSRAVIAVLDGADSDSGVGFEVGLAYARKIPVIGVRTDYRAGQEKGVNLMLAQACTTVIRELSFSEDTDQLALTICRQLQKALPF